MSDSLLRRACVGLPEDLRDERYREWAAEVPAILDDPGVNPAVIRWVSALLFAMDQRRTVHRVGRRFGLADRLRGALKAIANTKRRPASPASFVTTMVTTMVTTAVSALVSIGGSDVLLFSALFSVLIALTAVIAITLVRARKRRRLGYSRDEVEK